MGILFRKKKVYFFASAAVVALICLLGGILIVDGKNYSVFNVIWELPQSAFQNYGVKEVFDIGTTGWLYILVPVVSVPFASYFSDERKSKFYLYLKGRQGTLHYLCSRCLYALCSSAAVLFAAIGSYILLISFYFDLNPNHDGAAIVGGVETVSVQGLCFHIAGKMLYLLVYSTAMSLVTAFLIYLYNDLFVNLSLAFLLNYLLKNLFFQNKMLYPIAVLLILVVVYATVRKVRCEKL
ncbi:hypothetical protein AALA36_05845 [Lachnospiraceae bacterium 66-29]